MTKESDAWNALKSEEKLTSEQIDKFSAYASMLQEWNETTNLTAITSTTGIIRRHFMDSLSVRRFLDLKKTQLVADVGSGAGFPGIPLKIVYPHLKVILLEVNKKKQRFLNAIIKNLDLHDIEVCDLDFRTFIRTTEAPVDLFVSRASLDVIELSRLFKPGCSYKNAKLVYWASDEFEADQKIKHLVKGEFAYKESRKPRKLILFSL